MSAAGAELHFRGRVALVTGGTSGLGRRYAIDLARRGARVVVTTIDRGAASRADATAFVSDLRAEGLDVSLVFADAAVEADAVAAVASAIDTCGTLDVVVNNAGYGRFSRVQEGTTEQLRAMLDVHVLGTFWTMRRALAHMRAQGHGRIVNTVSGVGAFGGPDAFAYVTAKAAVTGMTKSAAIDNADLDIRVNAISPIAQTRMGLDFAAIHPGLDDNRMDARRVSPALLYLAHDSCSLNGEVLHAAGGRVARIVTAMTRGWSSDTLTPEDVAAHLDEICDDSAAVVLRDSRQQYDLVPKSFSAAPARPGGQRA